MYELLTGPLAWISFSIFFIGLSVRIILYIKGLDWKLDRVTYTKNVSYGAKEAARSLGYWLFPFGARGWRVKPLFTIMVFLFHISLLVTPVFLKAHNLLLQEKWGVGFWTISETTADMLTMFVVIIGILFILRRVGLPEVRLITNTRDIVALIITVAPFITGFIAHHQVSDYQFWLCAHIISGEIMLIAIPFTKLSHFVLFFLSRIQLGMDFGIKRGGMKGKGMAW